MAVEANFSRGLAQLSIIFGAVNIMTGRAGDSISIHDALSEIIALYAILVRCAIGEVIEGGLTQSTIFQLPKVS